MSALRNDRLRGAARDHPVLRTPRLVLRRPEPADAADIATALADHQVARMLARVPQPYDRQDAREWLAGLDRRPDFAFAIVPAGHAETRMAGMVGMVGIDERGGEMHIGYWLARSHWGAGLMTEAVAGVLAWYFAASPETTLHSGVFADNLASMRVQEKLGFAVIGRSDVYSLGRNAVVPHIDTVINAARFRAAVANRD